MVSPRGSAAASAHLVLTGAPPVLLFQMVSAEPQLLVCFFPFSGQETAHHELIIDLLVACAERGMAVWVISSNIDAICEKTENQEFLQAPRTITDLHGKPAATCGTKTSFFLPPAFFAAGRKASAEFCMARQLPVCIGTCPLAVPRPAQHRYSWVLSPFQIPAEKRLAALRQAGRFSFSPSG